MSAVADAPATADAEPRAAPTGRPGQPEPPVDAGRRAAQSEAPAARPALRSDAGGAPRVAAEAGGSRAAAIDGGDGGGRPLHLARRLAAAACRVALAGSLLVVFAALHMPAPSGFDDPATQRSVRGAWSAAGDVGRSAGSLVPDAIAPILRALLDDKVLHFALFFGLALLWAGGRALSQTLDARAAWIILGVLALYAGGGELLQALEGRVAEVGDWFANLLGAASGLSWVVVSVWLLRSVGARLTGEVRSATDRERRRRRSPR